MQCFEHISLKYYSKLLCIVNGFVHLQNGDTGGSERGRESETKKRERREKKHTDRQRKT